MKKIVFAILVTLIAMVANANESKIVKFTPKGESFIFDKKIINVYNYDGKIGEESRGRAITYNTEYVNVCRNAIMRDAINNKGYTFVYIYTDSKSGILAYVEIDKCN